jgi:hypothetical protein
LGQSKEKRVGQHPLIERAASREARQAKGFREVAAALTGEVLAQEWQAEIAGAPRRGEAGKKHLVAPNRRLAAERKVSRDSEHAALALVARARAGGAPLALPDDEGHFDALHAGIALRTAPADKKSGADDPNWGIDKVDLLGVGPADQLAVVSMRFLAPGTRRVGTGDTPLRALLEGLAHAAAVQANREAILAELAGATERTISDEPPAFFLLGSPVYWELCRKREAQKGAAWIREMERLAAEFEAEAGIPVRYLSLRLQGDPGWGYESESPTFEAEPRLIRAWDHGAGRVKPKPRPRSRKPSQAQSDEPVEPDLSRPVRGYALAEHYTAGDRIQHPTLGLGVVQGLAGVGKIRVHFDEKKSVLVHDRPSPGA